MESHVEYPSLMVANLSVWLTELKRQGKWKRYEDIKKAALPFEISISTLSNILIRRHKTVGHGTIEALAQAFGVPSTQVWAIANGVEPSPKLLTRAITLPVELWNQYVLLAIDARRTPDALIQIALEDWLVLINAGQAHFPSTPTASLPPSDAELSS